MQDLARESPHLQYISGKINVYTAPIAMTESERMESVAMAKG